MIRRFASNGIALGYVAGIVLGVRIDAAYDGGAGRAARD